MKTYNFELFLNEYEKVTVTTEPNFEYKIITIIGITLEDDVMIQPSDLDLTSMAYVYSKTDEYLKLLLNE